MSKITVKAILEGVNFTTAGKRRDDSGALVDYDNSVTLAFSRSIEVEKSGIKTINKLPFYIQLKGVDHDLPQKVDFYNKKIGQEIEISVLPTKDVRFVADGILLPTNNVPVTSGKPL